VPKLGTHLEDRLAVAGVPTVRRPGGTDQVKIIEAPFPLDQRRAGEDLPSR
jgi:hypothetical protein